MGDFIRLVTVCKYCTSAVSSEEVVFGGDISYTSDDIDFDAICLGEIYTIFLPFSILSLSLSPSIHPMDLCTDHPRMTRLEYESLCYIILRSILCP